MMYGRSEFSLSDFEPKRIGLIEVDGCFHGTISGKFWQTHEFQEFDLPDVMKNALGGVRPGIWSNCLFVAKDGIAFLKASPKPHGYWSIALHEYGNRLKTNLMIMYAYAYVSPKKVLKYVWLDLDVQESSKELIMAALPEEDGTMKNPYPLDHLGYINLGGIKFKKSKPYSYRTFLGEHMRSDSFTSDKMPDAMKEVANLMKKHLRSQSLILTEDGIISLDEARVTSRDPFLWHISLHKHGNPLLMVQDTAYDYVVLEPGKFVQDVVVKIHSFKSTHDEILGAVLKGVKI